MKPDFMIPDVETTDWPPQRLVLVLTGWFPLVIAGHMTELLEDLYHSTTEDKSLTSARKACSLLKARNSSQISRVTICLYGS